MNKKLYRLYGPIKIIYDRENTDNNSMDIIAKGFLKLKI